MRIETHGEKFIIVRGPDGDEQYFSFFVDHDSSCWSQHVDMGRKFSSRVQAGRDLKELRARDKIKRLQLAARRPHA